MSHHRAERFYLKLLLGCLIGLVVLIVTIWTMHGGYIRWQERRLVRSAVSALQHGDYRSANLAARNVLEIKPSSAAAARVMAELAERAGDRAALDWRGKVVQLEPQSTEDVLAWARCALQFNDLATAERALARVNESSRQRAGYHAVAGLLAQARGETDKAENEWSEAVRLAPRENAYRLQLGVIQLQSRDPIRHAAGEATLKELRQDPKQRATATRALIAEGTLRGENPSDLLQLGRELESYPEATFLDRLEYLGLLRRASDPGFTAYLDTLEHAATEQPTNLALLLSWMSGNDLNLLALDFLKNLPPDAARKWPVPLAIADVYVRLNDWHKLVEVATHGANWQQFEFLRHAYLARALRGEDKPAAAEHEWAEAAKGATARSDSVRMLLRTLGEWKWEDEITELLWEQAKQPGQEREALQKLYQRYITSGDAQGSYRVLLRLTQQAPDNLDFKNNLAQISLLLGAKVDDARRTAAEIYQKAPSNPAYATTYAYSLLTRGDSKGALKVMNSLTPDQLHDPAISAYYGLCLAAVRDQQAIALLQAGEKAHLLPEEKALVEKALASLGAQLPKQ